MLSISFKIVEPKRFDLYIEDIICGEDEAIVRIEHGAICKADLRYYLGARDERTLGFKYPMSLLHEAIGTIVLDKTNKFKVGDRVVLVPNIVPKNNNKCLNCVCNIPELGENYCPNAKFSSSNYNGFGREYVNYPVTNLIKIPDNVESKIAVFLELISVTIAAYRRVQLNGDETIAIWGPSWEDKIVNQVVGEVARSVLGGYNAEVLPMKRNEVAESLDRLIKEKVAERSKQAVVVESVQLKEIVLPEKIKEQIEKVQIANQEAERVRYEVQRAKQEAEKRAALATGEAEAKRIEAQGRADAVAIEAKAQSAANKVIAESLTSNLLQMQQIEVQGKFNEALRENKDAKIFLTPGGSTPNIWVDTKDKNRDTVVNQK